MWEIWHAWKQSLGYVSTPSLTTHWHETVTYAFSALVSCIRRYPWLFGADLLLSIILYKVILKSMINPLIAAQIAASPVAAIYGVYLALGVVIALALFITVCHTIVREHFSIGEVALRLVQVGFYVLLMVVVLSMILNALAVYQVPEYFRYMVYPMMMCGHVVILHWLLQQQYTMRGFARAIEFTVNFVMYNMPFFILAYGMLFGVTYAMQRGLTFLAMRWQGSGNLVYAICALAADKVVSFTITTLFLTVIMRFYIAKQSDRYTTLYFSS